MSPIGDPSNLTDQELSDKLKEYGIDVGPINTATRKTYERKLFKLSTGQSVPVSNYTPVDDDDDDDEEIILKPQAQTHQTPSVSQPRHRPVVQETHIPTPKGDSLVRPSLTSNRKAPLTSTPYNAAPRSTQSSNQRLQQDVSTSGSIPAWVKLAAVAVVLVLGYLIYTNMEANPVSQIPYSPSKVEV